MGLQGHIMTMATSSILNMMKEVDDLKKKSSSEILSGIQVNHETEDFQVIRVRRNHIWEDSLRAFKKHSFSHQKLLRIHFIGEEAEDAGGPRREYLRLLMKELAEKSGVLEGPEGHKVVTANSLLVFNKEYFYAGLMVSVVYSHFAHGPFRPRQFAHVTVSVSLRQGGPGICCLSPMLYSYISNQPVHDATLHDVADYTARANIEKIQNAEEKEFTQTVKSLADFLIACGLSKLTWSFEEKSVLVKLLCLHFLLHRSKIGVDQFTDGLKAGGLLEHIQNYPMSLKEVFIYSDTPINVTKFRSLLKYNYSPLGSNSREAEEMAVLLWEEYLDDIEEEETPDLNPDTLKELLIFVTGAEQIPPCGFDKKIEICFYDAHESGNPNVCRLPYASTCSMTLYLPLGLKDVVEFKTVMAKSLEGYGGFGSI
ncbi:G2/M phase-specific E3 ubiquitin-protein ligase-like [Actinia tenebrosa]|uniref:HECT-type E3 ubiquitin transferase n=1 Tax=Actinia tenebrosa TaxID=6105 RepID=A0A6P8HX31_ACTTE|nr:G2/M phase-specific E3 ubiquitin-protein ligase-like [Actinia tenebrosa]